jgi:hypothetical protein
MAIVIGSKSESTLDAERSGFTMLTIVFTDLANSALITSLIPGGDGGEQDRCDVETIKAPHCRHMLAGFEAF